MAGVTSTAAHGIDPKNVYPNHFEGSFAEFKERQLVFQLTRQLAEAQFVRGDRERSERLWQEAAMEGMDPERIIALLYGVHDHSSPAALEAVDAPYRQEVLQAARRARSPFARLASLSRRRRPGAGHRSAPRAGVPARRGGR